MKRTLDEKLEYNKKRKSESAFSLGYCFGVQMYRDYRNFDNGTKNIIKSIIAKNKKLAQTGDRTAKGIMCGVRDAANERKGK